MGDYIRSGKQEGLYALGRLRRQGYLGFGVDVTQLGQQAAQAVSGGGRALNEALARGESLASGLIDKATAYYQNWVKTHGSGTDAEIAQYFFMRGTDFLDSGAALLSQTGAISAQTAAQIQAGTATAREALKAGVQIFSNEGGTMDKIKSVGTFLKTAISFAKTIGAGESEADIASTIVETGMSCATMIMAAGPAWYLGAAGCAGQVVLAALSFTAAKAANTPAGIPAAYLEFANVSVSTYKDVTQQTLVARDAGLLAEVLYYHYALRSTKPIYDALTWGGYAGPPAWLVGSTPASSDDDVQLWGRTVEVFRGFDPSGTSPKPAVDLRSMLLAVTALDQHIPHSWGEVYNALHFIAKAVCANDWDEACHCGWNLPNMQHECGYVGYPSQEDLLAAHWYTGAGLLNQIGVATGASIARGLVATKQNPNQYIPFVRVDELINFFIAASLNMRRQNEQLWRVELMRFLKPSVPLRFYRVPDPAVQGKTTLSGRCWTQLNVMSKPLEFGGDPNPLSAKRAFIDKGLGCNDALYEKIDKDWSGNDVDAQRELAALRLMAAFSYLVWSYKTAGYEAGNTDLIAAQASNVQPGQIAHLVQMPCDPRQVAWTPAGGWQPNTYGDRHPWDPSLGAEVKTYWGTSVAGLFYASSAVRSQTTRDGRWLKDWIAAREASWRPIIAAALRAAAEQYGGGGGVAMVAPGTFTRPMLTPIEAGMLLEKSDALVERIVPVVTAQADCEAAGGVYDPAQGCVSRSSTSGGGGGGGVLLLGAAALLLMKFMKK